MRGAAMRVARAARRLWRGLREWSGDAAYERYLESLGRRPAAAPPLSREEFYLDQLRKRYARLTRCC